MSGLFDFGTAASASTGGAKKKRSTRRKSASKKVASSASSYKRTSRVHTSKSGTKRTVYTKDGKDYVKRRSSKTGKVRYEKI